MNTVLLIFSRLFLLNSVRCWSSLFTRGFGKFVDVLFVFAMLTVLFCSALQTFEALSISSLAYYTSSNRWSAPTNFPFHIQRKLLQCLIEWRWTWQYNHVIEGTKNERVDWSWVAYYAFPVMHLNRWNVGMLVEVSCYNSVPFPNVHCKVFSASPYMTLR